MTSVLDNLDQDHEILDIVYDSFVHVINYKTVNIIRHKLNLNYGHNVGLKRERQTDRHRERLPNETGLGWGSASGRSLIIFDI